MTNEAFYQPETTQRPTILQNYPTLLFFQLKLNPTVCEISYEKDVRVMVGQRVCETDLLQMIQNTKCKKNHSNICYYFILAPRVCEIDLKLIHNTMLHNTQNIVHKGLFTYYVSQNQGLLDPPSVSNGQHLAYPPSPLRRLT